MEDQPTLQDVMSGSHDRYFGLDPKICFYCKKPTADQSSEYIAELRKDQKVSVGLTNVKTEYKEVQIPIPRCAECKKKHKGASNFFKVFLVAGVVGGMYAGHELGGGLRIMMFLWAFIGAGIGAIVAAILRAIFGPKGANKTDDADLEQHPIIAKLMAEGYK